MEPELLQECAGWIAEQMAEEGYLIDPYLVELILEKERATPVRIPAIDHTTAATQLVADLAADGVEGVPDVVDARLIRQVLEWEDEFLSFAGRTR
ncbi:MAG: hypothetical protein U0531_01935 [Dehalococcoidia bacterium]